MTAIPPSEQTALLSAELKRRADPAGCTEEPINGARIDCRTWHIGRPFSRWCRSCVLLEAADALLASASREQELIDLKASYAETSADYLENRKALEAAEAQATALHRAMMSLSDEMQQFIVMCRSIAADPLTPLEHVRAHGAAAGRVEGFQSKLAAALHASPAPKGGESI